MAVWAGKRDGFSTREHWTSPEYPNYYIFHDDGASFYVAGHLVAGVIERTDKFFKAEQAVHDDHKKVSPPRVERVVVGRMEDGTPYSWDVVPAEDEQTT